MYQGPLEPYDGPILASDVPGLEDLSGHLPAAFEDYEPDEDELDEALDDAITDDQSFFWSGRLADKKGKRESQVKFLSWLLDELDPLPVDLAVELKEAVEDVLDSDGAAESDALANLLTRYYASWDWQKDAELRADVRNRAIRRKAAYILEPDVD